MRHASNIRLNNSYSREAYDELLSKIRHTIPGVTVSTDIISGFCGKRMTRTHTHARTHERTHAHT